MPFLLFFGVRTLGSSLLIAGLSTIEIGYLKHLYFKETIEVAYKAAGRVCLCKKGILTLTAGGGPETRLPRFKEIFEKAVVKQTLW